MDRDTGESTGEKSAGSFVPGKTEGQTSLDFSVDENLSGRSGVVVFETLRLKGEIIAEHRDIEDESQTVSLDRPVPGTGDQSFPAAAALIALLAAAGAVLLKRKRRS